MRSLTKRLVVIFAISLLLAMANLGRAQIMSEGSISKDTLLSTLESMQSRKSKRRDAAWYVAMIKEHKVDFELTPEVEQKIRLHGKYLGKEGIDKLITAVRENHRSDTAKQPSPSPQLERPAFREQLEDVTLTFGGGNSIQKMASLEKAPFTPYDLGGYKPITMYAEGGKLFVDAILYGDIEGRPIEIKHNEYGVIPPGWDINSNSTALEIVNKGQVPIFQLIYKSAGHVIVNGIFPHTGGVLVADDSKVEIIPNPPSIITSYLKPIFKYPSWKYPGQYADEAPTGAASPPLPIKRLRYSQEIVSSESEEAPYAVKVVIQTSVALQPTSLVVKCDSEFVASKFTVLGAGQLMGTGEGHVGDRTAYWLFFAWPAFIPENPVVVTLMSKRPIRVLDVYEGPPLPR